MFYYKVKILKAARFRRLTGVQKGTFAKMVEVLNLAEKEKHIKHGGRTSPLTMEDRLLMALMYFRQARGEILARYNGSTEAGPIMPSGATMLSLPEPANTP